VSWVDGLQLISLPAVNIFQGWASAVLILAKCLESGGSRGSHFPLTLSASLARGDKLLHMDSSL
jgi:hypothetical protein